MAFPTSKSNCVDISTEIVAAHINNIENKLGIDDSADTDSIDYRVGELEDNAILDADKATEAEIAAGTDDAKFITPKGRMDAKTNVEAYTPAGAGTSTLDLAKGNIHVVTMPAATQTLAISNEIVGQFFVVEIINATSQGALTWFTTIKWTDGIAPTLTRTNGKKDVFGFRVTGTDTYNGYIIGQNI